jgi:hypothetical protein
VKEGQNDQSVGQEGSNDAEALGEFIDVWKLSTDLSYQRILFPDHYFPRIYLQYRSF